ncbi:MAG: Uma2 family endonuclease [Geitlerinemataceae cyanobacterium]
MTVVYPVESKIEILYPISDDKPVAETFTHLYAILTILEVLRQYLAGRQATVLSDQYLYYVQGFPKFRVAPDIMVIFDVKPGGRDSYKIWEEGQVPKVIFEIASEATQQDDRNGKKTLYEGLGVEEYWLFDPKGKWIEGKLLGYRLVGETYQEIEDSRSLPLQLRIEVEGEVLGFYREDTGEKLLIPDELARKLQERNQQLEREATARKTAEQKVKELESILASYRDKFGELPAD